MVLRRLLLALLGLGSLLALWAFYALLLDFSLMALPDREISRDTLSALAAALAAVLFLATALLYPWLLDRLLGVKWIGLDEAGDVGPYLRGLLEQHGLPAPRLGVVVDDDPYGLCYGLARVRARLVLSSGLLKTLDVDEQCAFVRHEAAHLLHGDFVPATILATPLLLFRRLLDLVARGQRHLAPGALGTGVMVAPIADVALGIHEFLYAPLARWREVQADAAAMGASTTTPDATPTGHWREDGLPAGDLSRALVRVGFRLGRARAGKDAGEAWGGLVAGLEGFCRVDAGQSARLATWSAARGRYSLEDFVRCLRLQAGNPYARSGSRLGEPLEGAPDAASVGRERRERWLRAAPLLGFATGLAISIVLRGYVGLPLFLWGVGRLVALLGLFVIPRDRLGEGGLDGVLEGGGSWGRSFRVQLEGRLVGYGIPGQTRCPDPVLRVSARPSSGQAKGEALHVPLRLVLPLGRLQAVGQRHRFGQWTGESVTVTGFLRLRDVPYVEVHRVDRKLETLFNSWHVPVYGFLTLLLLFFGFLLILPQWMGV